MGYGILSSWIEPVKLTVTMGRVRQIKNVLRQCTKLFRLQDMNFQGCEAETNQPWILHWRMTEDNTDSLLNQFSSNPKKFHNEGILKFEKKKMVDILDTSDLEHTCEVSTHKQISLMWHVLYTLRDLYFGISFVGCTLFSLCNCRGSTTLNFCRTLA